MQGRQFFEHLRENASIELTLKLHETPSFPSFALRDTARPRGASQAGLTDLPLLSKGKLNAESLGRRLRGFTFTKVLTSPLKRAVQTCEFAGFGSKAEADRHLVEWNYGQYEGRTTREIHEQRPNWELFRDGCPGGETAFGPTAS